jgi:hypothetical protein
MSPVVHVFFPGVRSDTEARRVFGQLRQVIKDSPGPTTPLLHVSCGDGLTREMRLGVGVDPHCLMARLPVGVICVLDPAP